MGLVKQELEMQWFLAQSVQKASGGSLSLTHSDRSKTIILPPNLDGSAHDAQYRLTVMVPKRRFLISYSAQPVVGGAALLSC